MKIYQTLPGPWLARDEYVFNMVSKKGVKYFYGGHSSVTYQRDLQEWSGVTEPTSKLVYKDKK